MEKLVNRKCGSAGILAIVTVLLAMAGNAIGSGFALFTQGTSALGEGNAVTAHNDRPNAVFYNPALINSLDGTQIEAGTTLVAHKVKFRSDFTGNTEETDSDAEFPSTLYLTHKFNERVSAGLGIFSPFGLSTDWGKKWEGRYIATNSSLKTYTVNPVISFKVSPDLAIAVGGEYLYLDAELEKNLPLSMFGLADAGQSFEGDGDGFGFNIAFIFDINKDISFGASYRSRIRVKADGDVDHDLPAGTPQAIGALLPNTTGSSTIDLPQQLTFGIAYKGFDRLIFEIGGRWEEWRAFDELRVDLDDPVAGQTSSISERDWKNTMGVNIGGTYQATDNLDIKAGYAYHDNPIPASTFEPAIPDNNAHDFTAGIAYKYKRLVIDLSYAYQIWEGRTKNNQVDSSNTDGVFIPETSANGKYNTKAHLIGFALTYTF
jgi:long-chain fatty acid transport protein